MFHILADWTTAGPTGSLSWLTIAFTVGVAVTFALTLIEQWDAWKTYRFLVDSENEGLRVLAQSTLNRSTARVAIQLAFLLLASVAIYVGLTEHASSLYWYRITFIGCFFAIEILLCLTAINDIVARHKLEDSVGMLKEDNV